MDAEASEAAPCPDCGEYVGVRLGALGPTLFEITSLANHSQALCDARAEIRRLVRERYVMGLAIWWTTQGECEKIGDKLPDTVPWYIASEFDSRNGRPGRGRLWIAKHLEQYNPSVASWGETPMFRHLEECGGIVISGEDAHTLADLPGTITDLQGRRV